MRVTRIEIKDIGRHRHIDQEIDAPIVGILGPNGSGKSTFLQMFRLGFTGITEDESETYVRNFSPDVKAVEEEANPVVNPDVVQPEATKPKKKRAPVDPEKPANGSVKIWFEQGGGKGVIFRQIGKSPKRTLVWGDRGEDNPYTSAAEIASVLENILGADKMALDNAVFIPQGELDKLLFGDTTAREKLYARLMLVSFCDKISVNLANKSKALRATLKDMNALIDEVSSQFREAQKETHDLHRQSREVPPIDAKFISLFEAWKKAQTDRDAAFRRLWNAEAVNKQAMEQYTQALTVLRTEPHGFESVELLEQALQKKQDELASGSSLSALWNAARTAASNHADAKKRQESASVKLMALLKEVMEVKAKILSNEDEQKSRHTLAVCKVVKEARNLIPAADKEIARINAEIAAKTEELSALLDEENDVTGRIEKLKEEASPFEISSRVIKSVRSCVSDANHAEKCPVCDSGITAFTFSDERIQGLENKLAEYRLAIFNLTKKQTELSRKRSGVSVAIGSLNGVKTQHERSVEGHRKAMAAQENSEYLNITEAQIAEIEARLSASTSAVVEMVRVSKQHADATAEFKEAGDSLVKAAKNKEEADDACPKDFDPTQWAMASLKLAEAIKQMGMKRTTFKAAEAEHQRASNAFTEEKQNEGQAALAAMAAQAALTSCPLLASMVSATQHKDGAELTRAEWVVAASAKVTEYQNKANDLLSRFEQQHKTQLALDTRKKGIELAASANEKQRAVADELTALAGLFARDGLPMAYMRFRFGEIAELTSRYLAQLDATFIIRPESSRAMCFEFMRIDEGGSDVWMPQEKLSGGQRVRLTIAFLLAVQAVILPNVGFLILDEPSVHLDPQGVESLADMLARLGQAMGGSGSQVIVCDHSEVIMQSLTRTIKLGAKTPVAA